jgi:hypothetical protein
MSVAALEEIECLLNPKIQNPNTFVTAIALRLAKLLEIKHHCEIAKATRSYFGSASFTNSS